MIEAQEIFLRFYLPPPSDSCTHTHTHTHSLSLSLSLSLPSSLPHTHTLSLSLSLSLFSLFFTLIYIVFFQGIFFAMFILHNLHIFAIFPIHKFNHHHLPEHVQTIFFPSHEVCVSPILSQEPSQPHYGFSRPVFRSCASTIFQGKRCMYICIQICMCVCGLSLSLSLSLALYLCNNIILAFAHSLIF